MNPDCVINVRNLCKSYQSHQVIQSLSLELKEENV